MIVFLDTNLVIYFIENPAVYGPRATSFISGLRGLGRSFAVTDLVRMECRTLPLRMGDAVVMAEYDAFFTLAEVRILDVSSAVCDRATELRALYRFKPMDALHLAAAIIHGCDRFATNDTRLAGCKDIAMEVLP